MDNFLCRYNLPIVVVVMNNNGIYGGERRQQELIQASKKGADSAGFGEDPVPTAFVADSRYAFHITLQILDAHNSLTAFLTSSVEMLGGEQEVCMKVDMP